MITIEEKIKLAQGLGLVAQVEKWKNDIEMKESAKHLSDLHFKEITEEEIEKKLCSVKIKETKKTHTEADWLRNIWNKITFKCWIGIHSGTRYCDFPKHFREETIEVNPTLDSKKLAFWDDNIPYGALLALKEAKEAGLKAFKIYFPSTKEGFLKRHDPVIVGFTREKNDGHPGWAHLDGICNCKSGEGPMYEIFAWDDGKVYE